MRRVNSITQQQSLQQRINRSIVFASNQEVQQSPFVFLLKKIKRTEIEDVNKLSKEWMQKTLINLGFTETDANIYIHLIEEGPRKSSEIAKALKLHKRRIYRTLKKLQSKGMIGTSHECPANFSAVPFDKVLDLFIKANVEEAKRFIQNKEDLISSWRTIIRKDSTGIKDK